jgi:hypothetical protein
MGHDFMAVKSYSGCEIMAPERSIHNCERAAFARCRGALAALVGGGAPDPPPSIHASHPPRPPRPPARHEKKRERELFYRAWRAWRVWRVWPARAPGRCQAAAAARACRRRPSQPRQRSKTASGRRQPALHGVRHRCSARQGTHRACVDLHRTGERGAAASASPQPESCSPAAKCMLRSRAQRLLLPFSLLILRFGQLSPFTGCIAHAFEAERAVGARRLARSWFVTRAGGGRGMCEPAVPPRIHGFQSMNSWTMNS